MMRTPASGAEVEAMAGNVSGDCTIGGHRENRGTTR